MNLQVRHGYPVRRAEVLLVDDGVDCVLAPPGDARTHVLNPTARAIWELCDGRTSPEEMTAAICQVFVVSRGAAVADVERTLDSLTSVGLVDWVTAEGDST